MPKPPTLSPLSPSDATHVVAGVVANQIAKEHNENVNLNWQKLAFVALTMAGCNLLEALSLYFKSKVR